MPDHNQSSTPSPKVTDMATFAAHIARLLADGRCDEVTALDLQGVSQVADFFVIATGTSDRQMKSLAADVKALGREEGHAVYQSNGVDGGDWIIIDFVHLVVHLFSEEKRAYYDLESLWGDGKRINWATQTQPGQFARLGKDSSGTA